MCRMRAAHHLPLRSNNPNWTDTRASLMIAASDAHEKAKGGCFSRIREGVKLGGIIEEKPYDADHIQRG